MDAFEILVVILSVTLAIFLVLAIIATVFLIKILSKVNHITEQAESVANNIEAASEKFKQAAGPAALASVFAKLFNKDN
jgi:F0F1-type ATP synthase membrane subunit b/b'